MLKMKIIIAVCLSIFCIPALCIGDDLEGLKEFKPGNPIIAADFNHNFRIIDKRIVDLEKSLKDTQDLLFAQLESLESQLTNLQKNMIPKGTVAAFDLRQCPTGWSSFDDGAGRVIIGVGEGKDLTARSPWEKGGKEKVALSVDEMPKHKHGATPTVKGNGFSPKGNTWKGGGSPSGAYTGHPSPIQLEVAIDDNGKSKPHENMPPFIALTLCRKQ